MTEKLLTRDGEVYSIHISDSNSKLGKIPSFSTTPVRGCGHNCKVCAGKCYALKSYRQYPSTRTAWDDNLKVLEDEKMAFFYQSIVKYCTGKKKPVPVFRWFVAGDIYNAKTLWWMNAIAQDCPDTSFYCYTKCYDIVNNFVAHGFKIAPNLTIIFSKWDGLEMVNPYHFPESDVILQGTHKERVHNSVDCFNQGDKSITCDKCPCPCWTMNHGDTVYFVEH